MYRVPKKSKIGRDICIIPLFIFLDAFLFISLSYCTYSVVILPGMTYAELLGVVWVKFFFFFVFFFCPASWLSIYN
ncbi:hypothetical protein GGR55DRAFT_625583 [Xylaria sp. FL0064]|nr:hypothetical protein GGR55DRAFT_625583 [Xylaria sp. FL0064]